MAGTSSTLEWKSDGLNSNQFIFSTGPPSTNVAAFAVDTTPSKDLVQLPAGSYVIESSEGQNDSNDMAVVFNLLDSHGDVLTKIWGPQEGWHGVGTWSTVYDGTASTEGNPTQMHSRSCTQSLALTHLHSLKCTHQHALTHLHSLTCTPPT